MLPLSPDMASLSVGSNNFPTRVYENDPALVAWLASEMRKYGVKPEIEAFDLSHIFQAKLMQDRGELEGVPYVQFVMGVKNAMPVDRRVFDFYVETVQRLFGADAPWCAMRHRAASVRAEPMGRRGRGPSAHGARGQYPSRQGHARPVECRTCGARGRPC